MPLYLHTLILISNIYYEDEKQCICPPFLFYMWDPDVFNWRRMWTRNINHMVVINKYNPNIYVAVFSACHVSFQLKLSCITFNLVLKMLEVTLFYLYMSDVTHIASSFTAQGKKVHFRLHGENYLPMWDPKRSFPLSKYINIMG